MRLLKANKLGKRDQLIFFLSFLDCTSLVLFDYTILSELKGSLGITGGTIDLRARLKLDQSKTT